jgi:hypothetical protein
VEIRNNAVGLFLLSFYCPPNFKGIRDKKDLLGGQFKKESKKRTATMWIRKD